MATYPIRNRHWTRKEYDELIKSGFFDEDEPIEVYREPGPDRSAEFGWRFLDVQALRRGTTIAPLARPDVTVAVADLLP